MIESGLLTEAGDRYAVTGLAAPFAIPMSLHASLLARSLSLGAYPRGGTDRGSAGPFVFARADQRRRSDAPAKAGRCTGAISARRVDSSGAGTPPHAEYTFKHALVQDAAYDTLLRSNRQQLHARIAAVMERKFPEVVTSTPEVLAQHYASAGIALQAIPYWLKAGRVCPATINFD